MANLLTPNITTQIEKDLSSLSKEELTNYINNYLSECDKEYIMSNINKSDEHSTNVSDNINETYYCTRCHKKITEPESIKLGMGTVCYKKWLSEVYRNQYKKLF